MTRIADIAQHTRVLGFIGSAQNKVNDLQTQIGSGRKSQDYEGISRSAERLVSLEATHTRTAQYVENNHVVDRRLRTMESNVAQIFDVMSGYKTLLVDALNAQNAADLNMPVRAQEMLNQISSLLNVAEDGRYLFAGSMTNTQPVDLAALPPTYVVPTANGASSAYYQGNAQILSVRAGDNFDVNYGVTADSLGFEQAIRALDVVVKNVPTDTTTLNHALAVVTDALDNIANTRTQIGAVATTLGELNRKHDEFMLFTEQTIGEIENVDIAEAVSLMNVATVSLEASFMTLSRLSQLTLMNFLR
jgi:flagellar hook-associated protein 3 FlgL